MVFTQAQFVDFWGNPQRRSNPYGSPGSIYTLGYHIGEDISGLGETQNVPILRAGVVVESSRALKIGGYFAVKVPGDRYFDIYCHMLYSTTPNVGDKVVARQYAGVQAGWGDALADRGEDWTGIHTHFVQSLISSGAYDVVRGNDRNPNSSIASALTASAGGSGRPFPTPHRSEKEMILLKGPDPKDVHLVVAAPGLWDAYGTYYEPMLVKQFGDPVVLPAASMAAKKALYLGSPKP